MSAMVCEGTQGVRNFSELPRASAWLRLMLGLRGPRPLWQQAEVCGIARNRHVSWPILTSRFKPANMDRCEPSKAECLRSDLLIRDLFMRRRACTA